ncbi:MAG: L-ribulose-5-phosphate 4-epimerase [Sedimentisphaerales bacterium]|nr:L-ribulose-5-phosphate 4-epimerase [Sedimentisphaerales bacterium]MBN2842663.1 L-ribulose-5-phosphate 4-epimerase [Sedimentisphaerales bacterium]
MLKKLREKVCQANLELPRRGLVIYSWGNVSGIDRESGIVVIKPSGISYSELTPDKLVLLDLNGTIIEGELNPSSDTPTHLELYRSFPEVGGVCHTHSLNATVWSQACRSIPCLGTTHADYFYGAIPVTAVMTREQVEVDYELNTGKVIVDAFAGKDPMQMPAVLVAGHGPFTWGADALKSVESAVVLEQVAEMALKAAVINPALPMLPQYMLDKHYLRKHGKNAYYGQKKK